MPKPEKWRDWGHGIREHELGDKLNKLRKQDDKFCDITVCVGGKKFRSHRAVLSASSCYFETIFTEEFKEGKEIEINGNADSFELLLDYMYTGDLNLYVENAKPDLVCGFLDIVCYMQMTNAIEECIINMHHNYDRSNELPSEYSYSPKRDLSDSDEPSSDEEEDERPIPVADAYRFLLFAKTRDELARLARFSRQYLQDHVEKLQGCIEILNDASVDFMEEFLSDEYNSTETKEVLDFVIKWLNVDWNSRKAHAYRLLKKIRLDLVNLSNCAVVLDAGICAIPECKALLEDNKKEMRARESWVPKSYKKKHLEKWKGWDDYEKHKLVDKLTEMRKQNKLCDITICVDGKEFRAHKAFLSATSCFFETMFTGGFKEGTAKEIEINGNADSFEMMLQYIYTGELHIAVKKAKTDIVCGFLDMACYMQISDAIKECTNNMHRIYDTSDVLASEDRLDKLEHDSNDSEPSLVVDKIKDRPNRQKCDSRDSGPSSALSNVKDRLDRPNQDSNDAEPNAVKDKLKDGSDRPKHDSNDSESSPIVNKVKDKSDTPKNDSDPESSPVVDKLKDKSDKQTSGSAFDEDKEQPIAIPVADAYYYLLFAKLRDGLAHLARLSAQYLQENVTKLKSCDDILEHATVEFMEEFLSDEYLATADEEKEVLHFVVNWLKFDWKARKCHAYRVLQKIRLGLVELSIRNEVFDEDICAIQECKDLLDKVTSIEDEPSRGWDEGVEQIYPDLFATRSTMMVAVSGHPSSSYHIDPEYNTSSFEYFDVSKQEWKSIDGFQQLPKGVKDHALCYAAPFDNLYLAGGSEKNTSSSYHSRSLYNDWEFGCYYDEDENEDDEEGWVSTDYYISERCFYCFDKQSNKWSKLPAMQKPRSHFPLVNLGWNLYAIGGVDSCRMGSDVSNVEYYNLDGWSDRKWKYAAPLKTGWDQLYSTISAVAYKEVILAYGSVHAFKYELNIYYPRCNRNIPKCDKCVESTSEEKTNADFQCDTWRKVFSEEISNDEDSVTLPKLPTLFVSEGICYRIVHHACPEKSGKGKPVVNVLDVEQTDDNQKKVTIGEAVNQDYIPYNKACAFRIRDRVFAIEHESVFDTGIRITEDHKSNVDLGKIEAGMKKKMNEGLSTSIVTFSFDKRFLL